MRAEPVPASQLLRRHIVNSRSRVVIGPFDHRFLVHLFRRHGDTQSIYRVHSLTAWEPGWKTCSSIAEVRRLIDDYSTPRIH